MELESTLNWDDVRVFLALVRSTSLRQAADALGVSHPTVRRRLDTLEAELGVKLFDRRPAGLRATAEARELELAAEEVERSMLSLGRRMQGVDSALRGSIRLTLPDMLATDLLMPDFAVFCARWPEIELQIEADYAVADLGRREADVALRVMPHGKLPKDDLKGRLAVTAYSAVYGTGKSWIGWRGAEADAEWVARSAFPDLPVRGAINHVLLQKAAAAAGMGLSQLPCFVAEPELTRKTEPEPALDIWVLVHPDLVRSPRLRVFREAIVEALRRHRPQLEGRG